MPRRMIATMIAITPKAPRRSPTGPGSRSTSLSSAKCFPPSFHCQARTRHLCEETPSPRRSSERRESGQPVPPVHAPSVVVRDSDARSRELRSVRTTERSGPTAAREVFALPNGLGLAAPGTVLVEPRRLDQSEHRRRRWRTSRDRCFRNRRQRSYPTHPPRQERKRETVSRGRQVSRGQPRGNGR